VKNESWNLGFANKIQTYRSSAARQYSLGTQHDYTASEIVTYLSPYRQYVCWVRDM